MASEIIQGFGKDDDPLNKALDELKRPEAFTKMYDSSQQRHDETVGALVTALRLVIGELQGLRDEVEELRREQE